MMCANLKNSYINFIHKKKYGFFSLFIYAVLYALSFIYRTVIFFRNFAYDRGLFTSLKPNATLISVGNISWGGSGKTTLTAYLYNRISHQFKTAILRRGWGRDEEKLLKNITPHVLSAKNRAEIIENFSHKFECFILDDGFQYRKLIPHVNIVIMAAREITGPMRFIPAGIFREGPDSLRRADFLIINYKEELTAPENTKKTMAEKFPHLKIYFSTYKFKCLKDINGNTVDTAIFKNKKLAALSATGYPQGFFNKIKEANIQVARKIIYPDHYEFKNNEFINLQRELKKENIEDIIITRKDLYHFQPRDIESNIIIFEIEIMIEDQDQFWNEIDNKICINQYNDTSLSK